MTIYSAVAGTETFAPKISENKEITKIASVNGIVGDSGFGIAHGAVTQRIAAISAMYTSVLSFWFFIVFLSR